jgi:hypothetical protein
LLLVTVPPTVTLDGVRLQVRPADGEITFERTTVPENPLRLLVVIVDGPAPPARTVTSIGDGPILKSWTIRVIITK